MLKLYLIVLIMCLSLEIGVQNADILYHQQTKHTQTLTL